MKALRIAIVSDVFCDLYMAFKYAIHFTKILEVGFDDNIF